MNEDLKFVIESARLSAIRMDRLEKYLEESTKRFDEKMEKFEKESEESAKRFDERMEKFEKELDESTKRFNERMEKFEKELDESTKRFDERMEKLDKKLNKIGSIVGAISNNQGNVAEEYFINSLEESLKVGKIDFDYLIENFKAKKGHRKLAEYDILLVNGKSVAIVEVKYKAHINDLEQLPKKIEELKKLPQYENYKVYAGIATFYATDELIEKAKEKGYFVLQRRGEVLVTHAENLKAS